MSRGSITAYLSMMPSTVTVANLTTGVRSPFGAGSYSTSATKYRARIVDVTGRMRVTEGFGSEAKLVAWIASTSTGDVRTNSKVTLPDGSVPPIMSVEYPRDETGPHHCKVTFG